MQINRNIALSLLLLAGVCANSAFAHAPQQGNVFLQIEDHAVSGRVELAIPDLDAALGLRLSEISDITAADIEPYFSEISGYVTERVALTIGGVTRPLPVTGFDILELSFATFVQVNFAYEDLDEEPKIIDVKYSAMFDVQPEHRGMLVIESFWKAGTLDNEANVSGIFEPGRETQTLDLSRSSTLDGFMAMVGLGTHHIWIGIDHILFLLALLLPAAVYRKDAGWQPVTGFRPALIHVVKVVTIFTIAHTITLSLAALNTITLSSRLVESVIAISIAAAALHIIVPIFKGRIWLVVFIFGLFHGFGFASVLGELGIPSSYMVHSLLAFNVGVELGQLAIVLVLFPILYLVREIRLYARVLLPAAAAGLIVISLYWFTERAFLIDLPAGAIMNQLLGLEA